MSEIRNYPAGIWVGDSSFNCLTVNGLRSKHEFRALQRWNVAYECFETRYLSEIRCNHLCELSWRKPLRNKGMDFVKKITNYFHKSLTPCWQSIRFFT